jgi:hypothetical protein
VNQLEFLTVGSSVSGSLGVGGGGGEELFLGIGA